MPTKNYLTTVQSAIYVDMDYELFRFYVKTKRVIPDIRTGNSLLFSTRTLDTFKATPRASCGRPKLSRPVIAKRPIGRPRKQAKRE